MLLELIVDYFRTPDSVHFTLNRVSEGKASALYIGGSLHQLNNHLKVYGIEWDLRKPGEYSNYRTRTGDYLKIRVISKEGTVTIL